MLDVLMTMYSYNDDTLYELTCNAKKGGPYGTKNILRCFDKAIMASTDDDSSLRNGPMQNLPLSVSIMVLSGALRVSATMALAYPDHRARRNGESLQASRKTFLIAVHILLLTGAAGLGILGTIYGPVAIAVPVQTGSQLILNILAMESVLEMRSFNKIQRTGTYIVTLSILLLMDVGPGPQDAQNITRLLSSPTAVVWILLVSLGLVLASIKTIQFFRKPRDRRTDEDQHSDSTVEDRDDNDTYMRFLTLVAGVTLSNVAMATAGKCLGFLSGGEFMAAAMYYLLSALLGLLFSITSSTSCDQGLFTPACAAALIFVNLFTGIIIWEDWKVVHAWVGYICALLLMCCGVYLLAEIDLLKTYFDESPMHQTNDVPSHYPTVTPLLQGSTGDDLRSPPSSQSEGCNNAYRLLEHDEMSNVSTSRSSTGSEEV